MEPTTKSRNKFSLCGEQRHVITDIVMFLSGKHETSELSFRREKLSQDFHNERQKQSNIYGFEARVTQREGIGWSVFSAAAGSLTVIGRGSAWL